MHDTTGTPSSYDLSNHGLHNLGPTYWTLSSGALVEHIVRRGEAALLHQGAVAVRTVPHTGRSPQDKFIVQEAENDGRIWWGKVNLPVPEETFDRLYERVSAYLQGRGVFVQDAAAGADPEYRLPIRVVTEHAWQSLFARNLFLRLPRHALVHHRPEFTVLVAPGFQASPERDGTRTSTFILVHFGRRTVLIGGTSYAGEIKKSIFTVLNYLLPERGILSMHCSANVGESGDVALFFGLSGTGKTTLSSVADRPLIGDDEHGWGASGVFNFEGGCYAKTIRLDREQEPIIWSAVNRFGTILENVAFDPTTRHVDFDDDSLTENTRAAYPIRFVENHVSQGMGAHPKDIFFLTADAFGVMPPIARLGPDQAMYYFLSGYTSKLAGTERGLGDEPQATFSACFGAPFLPLPPRVYAELLKERIRKHKTKVWLLNTGWIGGGYGQGRRIRLAYTRAMVTAALRGDLDDVPMRADPYFRVPVPERCPGVPPEVLDPSTAWPDAAAYQDQARRLVARFEKNFADFEADVPTEVREAGPVLERTVDSGP
jgi:phosphoenolpyruvate carboxykinase (ATP)